MLSSDLNRRAAKLQQEQKARLEVERRKAEKERLSKERVKANRQKELDEASRRKAAALAEAEIERQQHDEEIEHNRGVWWQQSLRAVPLDERSAQEKGIRRLADKVSLPSSAGRDLMQQDVPKNGTIFFQLRASNGKSTHAGSLDFSALDGTIAVPSQVAANLWPGGIIPEDAMLTVTYRRLEKGQYVRLQPSASEFHQQAGHLMEDVLVDALSKRSAISVGDQLQVSLAEKTFELRVQHLQPAPQVSVIDTEMEADVEPSKETEERLRAEEEARHKKEREREAQLAAREAFERAEQDRIQLEDKQRMEESAAALPEEPGPEASSLTCVFRFPDGSRAMRRFRPEDPSSLLYTYVNARGPSGYRPGHYRLTLQYPRRPVEENFRGTLQQAGLSGKQETIFLEPVGAH